MTDPISGARNFGRSFLTRCFWSNGEEPERLANWFRFAGWLATNICIVLALPFLLFLAITGFSFELALLQIDNLTDRFADADATRRALFESQCRYAVAIIGTFVCILRWPALVRANGGGAS